jgi:hypothetical protein
MPFHAPLYLSMPRVEMVFNQVLGSVAEDVGRVFGHRGEASLLVRANRTRIHPFAAAAERRASGAAGRGSAADAVRRRLHAVVRLGVSHLRRCSTGWSLAARFPTPLTPLPVPT